MVKLVALALIVNTGFACSSDYAIWIPRSSSADALYRFAKDGKAGYIDAAGHVIIPPTLPLDGNYGYEFHDGLLEISVSDGKYVDRTGKVVLDKGLYRGWDFSEGLAVASKESRGLFGYIDTKGEFAIAPRFPGYPNGYVYSFSEGLATIEAQGLFGYINRSGAFEIAPQFLDGRSFADGMARVVVEGPCVYFSEGGCGMMNPVFPGAKKSENHSWSQPPCKFTYIDKTGRIISRRPFDAARDFSEGLAAVRIGGVWGFIDTTGAIAIAPKFEDAGAFSSGLSKVRVNGFFGYIDKAGSIAITPQFEDAEDFQEAFAVVGDGDGHLCYIDRRGKQAFTERFEVASPFFKGLAHVELLEGNRKTHRFAYINTTGRHVFEY